MFNNEGLAPDRAFGTPGTEYRLFVEGSTDRVDYMFAESTGAIGLVAIHGDRRTVVTVHPTNDGDVAVEVRCYRDEELIPPLDRSIGMMRILRF